MSLLSIHHFLCTYIFLHVYCLAGDESEGEGEFPGGIYNRDGAMRGARRESLGCSLAPELNPVIFSALGWEYTCGTFPGLEYSF